MQRIKVFLKRIILGIIGEFKKISILQALIIVFLAIFFLIIGAYFDFRYFTSVYGEGELEVVNIYYFDYFVRNGGFKIPYFLFATFLIASIGQIFLAKGLKKNFPFAAKINIMLLVIGFVGALGIYAAMPYYLFDISSYDLSRLDWKDELDVDVSYSKIDGDSCGSSIDYFFAPTEGFSLKGLQAIREVGKELPSASIDLQCLDGGKYNADRICKKEFGLDSRKADELFESLFVDKARPVLVVGCEHAYKGMYAPKVYIDIICKHLDLKECAVVDNAS